MWYDEAITVVLPVYNASSTIESTVKSVEQQQLKNINLIIVNDGSKDDTLNKIEMLMKKYSNIELVNQPNRGVSVARNKGLSRAKGKYVFFLDADDKIGENALKKMLSLAEYRKLDIVFCNHLEHNSTIIDRKSMDKESFVMDTEELIGRHYDQLFAKSACAKLFRRSLLKKNNITFSTYMSLGEDMDFSYRALAHAHKVGYVGSAFYIVENTNPSSLSKKYVSNLEESINLQYQSWKELIAAHPYIGQFYNEKNIEFGVYLLIVYFGNLFRYNSPLTIKEKKTRIERMLSLHKDWIENAKKEKKSQNLIERISLNVILSSNSNLIFMTFLLKEKLRRLKFFVGKK